LPYGKQRPRPDYITLCLPDSPEKQLILKSIPTQKLNFFFDENSLPEFPNFRSELDTRTAEEAELRVKKSFSRESFCSWEEELRQLAELQASVDSAEVRSSLEYFLDDLRTNVINQKNKLAFLKEELAILDRERQGIKREIDALCNASKPSRRRRAQFHAMNMPPFKKMGMRDNSCLQGDF